MELNTSSLALWLGSYRIMQGKTTGTDRVWTVSLLLLQGRTGLVRQKGRQGEGGRGWELPSSSQSILCFRIILGASVVAKWVKLLPAMPVPV